MRKQCVPGPFSPSSSKGLGTRLPFGVTLFRTNWKKLLEIVSAYLVGSRTAFYQSLLTVTVFNRLEMREVLGLHSNSNSSSLHFSLLKVHGGTELCLL